MASKASKAGGYDCKFVDTPPDKLMCQICLLVARTSHQMTCCGRVYCKTCLNEHKKHSNTCPNCRKRGGQDFPDTRGKQEIKSLKVKCNNCENGCGWVGELRSLDNHLTTCGYELLCCTNQCMENNEEVHVLRRDLDQHLKKKCPYRQYQCCHCKDTGRYCDITTTHLDTCPKLEVPCPNDGCKASVPRCDVSDHRSTCQLEKVVCKYAAIGCEEEPLRKDLEQHENDAILHLHLAIDTVNQQQEEINQQREEINQQWEVMMALIEEKIINDSTKASQAGQPGLCVFKMPEFSQHKSSKQGWYSPPFYTHPRGYKMCISVDADGCDDGAGTHISVFAYLMKGKYDDNLPWPFTGEVTITLLNQLEDENHHTDMISFPPDSDTSGRVLDSERAAIGYGESEFISHDQLGYYVVRRCRYLKDDCLYFQVKLQAAEPVKPWLTCTV